MSFSILEFKDGVQLVPSCWLVHGQDKCFFPKFLSLQRITKSIEEQEKPESNWRVYNVKRIFGTAATYNQGLRKLDLATRFIEIDDEVESFEESKEIKLSNHEQYTKECLCCKKIQSPLRISKYISHDENVQISQPIYLSAESSHPVNKANLIDSDFSSSTIRKENHESFNCQKQLEFFKKKIFHRLDKLNGMIEAINTMNKSTESNMNEKLKSIEKINEKLESFEKKLEKFEEGKYSYDTFDDVDENIFPLSSIEALDQFEIDLKDKDYFAQMVKYFGKIGGPDNNLASNILSKMLSKELANECNWRGLNKKKAFSKLRLNLVVLEAVQRHCPLAKKHEVYNTIARWLVCTKMKLERKEERKRKSLPAKLE